MHLFKAKMRTIPEGVQEYLQNAGVSDKNW